MTKRNLFAFCVLQGLLWCVASIGYFYVNGFAADRTGHLFTFFFVTGHTFLFAWLLGLLCTPFAYLGPKALQTACVSGGSILSAWLGVDLIVFAQYRFHIDLALLEMFFGPAGGEIFAFPAGLWTMAALGTLAIIAVEAGLVYLSKRLTLSNRWIAGLLGLWLVCFVGYNGLYAWGKFYLIPSVISQQKVLPFAYPLSANRQLEKWGFSPKKDPLSTHASGSLRYPLATLTCHPPTVAKNILIFMIDAWRADMLTEQIMPQLSSWTQQPGMHIFTNHLSGGNSTMGGVFSLFYGMPHSYWDDFTSQHLPPLLISQALSLGYEPGIFASSKLTSPAFDRNIFATIPHLRIGSAGNSSWERDENAVKDFEHFLDTRNPKQPFFGFIFLDAPHGYSSPSAEKPFTPAKEMNYLLLTNHTDPTPYLNQYKNAVHFTDRLIGHVFTDLQKRHLLENTVIILTADHGQELNDSHRNFWGHNGNFTDYQTKVPLVIYDASNPKSVRLEYRTTHHDIAPTVLQNLYGCTNPAEDYTLGRNLFDSTPRPPLVSAGHTEKVIRWGDDILVFNKFGRMEQYNHRLEPVSQPLPPEKIQEGLKAFSRFYK